MSSIFNLNGNLDNRISRFQNKVAKMYDDKNNLSQEFNPFLDKKGELINPYINYQKVLDNSEVTQKAKDYIQKATGITPAQNVNKDKSNLSESYTYSYAYDGTDWGANSSDGALNNKELKQIVKDVSSKTGVPTNVLLAVIQQETSGKWIPAAADGKGHSYGYMMLYDYGVIADLKAKGQGSLAEKAKIDPYTNVLVGAKYLKQFYDKTGSWQSAAAKYNGSGPAAQKYGIKVWDRANSQPYLSTVNANKNQNTNGNKYVNTAKQYIGTPYVFGGASPKGFDCSGLVQYVYARNGKNIPRTAQAQYEGGTVVSASQLQPGDLVFFRGANGASTSPGHVGLYIGNGQYIQSPQTGDVVKVSNLSDRKDYIGARRY